MLLLIAVVTAVAGYSASKGVLASSVIRLFFGENPDYTAYRALADRFGGSDVMVVAYEDEALLTPQGLARLGRIADRVAALPFVRSVQSMDRASRIEAREGDLVIERWGAGRDSAEALERALAVDPRVAGWLVSKDGGATAVLVELDPDPDRAIEAVPEMLNGVRAAFTGEGVPPDGVHMAGIVAESAEATAQARFTLERLFPLTIALLGGVVLLLFLRVWPVIITGGVALVAIVWTLGAAIAVDPQVNLLMAMAPGMITVIAFSDVIHLYSAFSRELEHGATREEAVLTAGAEVGEACLYTSLTTFVGFASLVFIPTPVIRQLGVVLGVGVGIALLLALTLVPIALSALPGARPGRAGESARSARLLDGILAACMHASTRYPRAMVAGFAALIAGCAAGIAQMEVEASFTQRLAEDNRVRQARDFIEARFAGASFLDVYVTAKEDDLLDPEVFAGLARFEARLEEEPGVDGVLSLVDLVRALHQRMAPDATELPASRALVAQYLLLFEVAGGEGLSRAVDDARTTTRLSVRLDTDGLRALARAGDRAAEIAAEELPAGVEVRPTGIAYLLGDWVTFVLEGQRRGLAFAVLSTALMMMWVVRSFSIGALSMIPNLLPLVALGGWVGWAWEVVDSDTILVATFAIGIAVDDTIHFLTRLRMESSRQPDRNLALRRTFMFTGRAIVQTTIILCIGFSPFAFSDYFSTRIIGTLLPMTLVVALVADLLLVPALVELGVLRFRRQE